MVVMHHEDLVFHVLPVNPIQRYIPLQDIPFPWPILTGTIKTSRAILNHAEKKTFPAGIFDPRLSSAAYGYSMLLPMRGHLD